MGIHKGLARAALTAGVVAGVLVPGAGAAVAAPSDVVAAAECSFIVQYDGLAVRENPSPNSVVRKTKAKGSRVNGPCWDYTHEDSGEWYSAVYCSCATDGVGWMRRKYLAIIIN